MSSTDEIAAAFDQVDQLLLAAAAVAPSLELLLARAAERGITETKLADHLGLNATVVRWLLNLEPDATVDRIDLDTDAGELLLRWARS